MRHLEWSCGVAVAMLLPAVAASAQPFEPETWISELASKDAAVRHHQAALNLNRCGHACREAVPALLGVCGGAPEVELLLALVEDPSVNVRAKAIGALGELGAGAAAAVPTLERLAADTRDTSISDLARAALGRIRLAMKPPAKTPNK